MKTNLDPGLLARISRATSEAEIDALLNEGRGYERASLRTMKRWQIRAAKRRQELENAK